jgi:hypothetical protein
VLGSNVSTCYLNCRTNSRLHRALRSCNFRNDDNNNVERVICKDAYSTLLRPFPWTDVAAKRKGGGKSEPGRKEGALARELCWPRRHGATVRAFNTGLEMRNFCKRAF